LGCSRHGEIKNAYKILVGKPERMRPLGKPRRRWDDNIRTDLRQTGWSGCIWLRIESSGGPL